MLLIINIMEAIRDSLSDEVDNPRLDYFDGKRDRLGS